MTGVCITLQAVRIISQDTRVASKACVLKEKSDLTLQALRVIAREAVAVEVRAVSRVTQRSRVTTVIPWVALTDLSVNAVTVVAAERTERHVADGSRPSGVTQALIRSNGNSVHAVDVTDRNITVRPGVAVKALASVRS